MKLVSDVRTSSSAPTSPPPTLTHTRARTIGTGALRSRRYAIALDEDHHDAVTEPPRPMVTETGRGP